MKIFSLPNLTSQTPNPIEVQSLNGVFLPRNFASKKAWIEWGQQHGTAWHFLSSYEGITPGLRVTTANPPVMCHGLVLDYDCGSTDWKWEEILTDIQTAKVHPTYVHQTVSGGARLIWPFDKPVLVHESVWKKVVTALVKGIRADKLLDSLDDCYTDPGQYYGLYGPVITYPDAPPISADRVYGLVMKHTTDKAFRKLGTVIPLEAIAKEVAERFPGRWEGEFVLGARGCRFWDGAADNPTAAIVRETGMQCFTGLLPFVPWQQILGARFLKDYEDNRVGEVLQEEFYYDGKDYWRKIEGLWYPHNKSDFVLELEMKGLSYERVNNQPSEISKTLNIIHNNRRIHSTANIFHQPLTVQEINCRKILNTSVLRLMQPHPEPVAWGDGFPRLAAFYEGWFEEVPGEGENIQLVHYLAWLQHFYKSCLAQKPQPGQILFIAGPVDQGKTMSSTKILGDIFGGFIDASNYVTGKDPNTGMASECPIWALDDTIANEGFAKQNFYAGMIKKIAANPYITLTDKWVKSTRIDWNGRVIVTCNIENEALRIIPSPEENLMDKIMILKLAYREGFDLKGLRAHLDDELPYFCRWLVDWDTEAEGVIEASRYVVSPFHHPELVKAAKSVSASNPFRELLQMHFANYFTVNNETSWTGTASELISAMSIDDRLKMLVQAYTPVVAGRMLNQMMSQGRPLKRVTVRGSDKWRFTREFLEEEVPVAQ